MKDLVQNIANTRGLTKSNIREFLNETFNEVSKQYNLCKDFQARAAKFGEAFEACFEVIIEKLYPNLGFDFIKDFELPKACLKDGGEADFAVLAGSLEKRRLIAIIETKGAADKILCDGKNIKLPRPGMLRTDTVKKAISNAYQVSRACPNMLFFIVTSHKATSGNAKCMCDLAEGDIIDKIVDITVPQDLDDMINTIKLATASTRQS